MPESMQNIGIMSKEDYRKGLIAIAIAKGEHVPGGDEPKVWTESLQALAEYTKNHSENSNNPESSI